MDTTLKKMMTEKIIYTDIIKTIEEPFTYKEKKPRLYSIPNVRDMIVVDLPRNGKYHGTTFSIKCPSDGCYIRGDIVVRRDDEKETVNKVDKSNCNIISVHKHPESIMATIPGKEEYQKESHIHFECIRKSYDDTLKITRFLRHL